MVLLLDDEINLNSRKINIEQISTLIIDNSIDKVTKALLAIYIDVISMIFPDRNSQILDLSMVFIDMTLVYYSCISLS